MDLLPVRDVTIALQRWSITVAIRKVTRTAYPSHLVLLSWTLLAS